MIGKELRHSLLDCSRMNASSAPGPWFQGDYRCSSPFRGGKPSEWGGGIEKSEKGARYGSLAIAEPSTTVAIQADSGVGSMSPSPPKTPTPDYDSLEDIFDDEHDSCTRIVDNNGSCTRIVDGIRCPTVNITDASLSSLPGAGQSSSKKVHHGHRMQEITSARIVDAPLALAAGGVQSKKVHFSAKVACPPPLDESSGESSSSGCEDNKSVGKSSSWRDALVVSPVDQLSFCYRQDWAKSKALKTTTLGEHLDQRRSSRRRHGRLVRRSSSLDRLTDLRHSYRSPMLCDPDPLKVKKKILGRSDRQSAADDG